MKLLVLILSKVECMPSIIAELVREDCGDPTVISCEGALSVIDSSNVEPPPIFGGLRFIVNHQKKESKMMFVVLRDEDVPRAQMIIDDAVGGIDRPNTGIMFTLPADDVKGLRRS